MEGVTIGVQHYRPENRFSDPLRQAPLRHSLWYSHQQLGALKRVGSRIPFRVIAFRRILTVQAVVEMAGAWNRKLAQPFPILDLSGDQDNFLAFGVAGLCHGCLQLDLALAGRLEKIRQPLMRVTYAIRGSRPPD
jgi:hypothetical protein